MAVSQSASMALAHGQPIILCGTTPRDELYAAALDTGFKLASMEASQILKDSIALPFDPKSKLPWLLMIEAPDALPKNDEYAFLDFLFDGSRKFPENIVIAVNFSSMTGLYHACKDVAVPITVLQNPDTDHTGNRIRQQPSVLLAA